MSANFDSVICDWLEPPAKASGSEAAGGSMWAMHPSHK
jgi:hypothetical protein